MGFCYPLSFTVSYTWKVQIYAQSDLADFQCKTDCQVIMFRKDLFNSEYAVKNKSLNERYES